MNNRHIRIIRGPSKGVQEMILDRLPKKERDILSEQTFNAIALINGTIPNIYFYADIAQKAGQVHAAVLQGTCPQHITTLVLFGEMAAVNTAVKAIKLEDEK